MIKRPDSRETLALSLMELMETIPLQKITIGKIATNCGLTRQTFYHYFKDKYDLTHWIFRKLVDDAAHKNRELLPWPQVLGQMLWEMKQHQSFYVNAFHHTSQNSLRDFMISYTRCAYEQELKQRIHTEEISPSLLFSITFNSYGAVGVMSDWIDNSMKEDPYELALKIAANMPREMQKLFS